MLGLRSTAEGPAHQPCGQTRTERQAPPPQRRMLPDRRPLSRSACVVVRLGPPAVLHARSCHALDGVGHASTLAHCACIHAARSGHHSMVEPMTTLRRHAGQVDAKRADVVNPVCPPRRRRTVPGGGGAAALATGGCSSSVAAGAAAGARRRHEAATSNVRPAPMRAGGGGKLRTHGSACHGPRLGRFWHSRCEHTARAVKGGSLAPPVRAHGRASDYKPKWQRQHEIQRMYTAQLHAQRGLTKGGDPRPTLQHYLCVT